jgi:hypothetical protein
MCALWGPGAVHACCDVILYDNACIVTTWVLLSPLMGTTGKLLLLLLLGYYWVRYWVLLVVTTWVLLGCYWVRYWVLLVVTTWVLLGPLLGTGSYYLGTTGSVTGYYW